jgi:hypothetical protein
MIGGMSLALGLVQLVVWVQRREAREHTGLCRYSRSGRRRSVTELMMLSRPQPAEFAHALRLTHSSFGTALLCMPVVRLGALPRRQPGLLLYSATALRLVVIGVSLASAIDHQSRRQCASSISCCRRRARLGPWGRFNPWVIPRAPEPVAAVLLPDPSPWSSCGRRGNPRGIPARAAHLRQHARLRAVPAGTDPGHLRLGRDMPYLITAISCCRAGAGLRTGQRTCCARAVTSDRLGQSEIAAARKRGALGAGRQIAGIAPWSWDAATGELKLSKRRAGDVRIAAKGPARIEDWRRASTPRTPSACALDLERTMASRRASSATTAC